MVADNNELIVGHILFTKIQIRNKEHEYESLALAPVAVLPDYQQQGIGGQLIQKGLQKAKVLGYKSVIVLGHEQYYARFGFAPSSLWNIKAPFDVPDKAFMALELHPDALQKVSGTVRYAKEFNTI